MPNQTIGRQVLLDTDLGSDVDDAMALAQLLGTPEVSLLGLTTVYGDTRLRARIAQRYASSAGRQLTVVPGESTPLSGREVWWPGHEGTLHENLDAEPISDGSAVEHLIKTVNDQPGQVDLVAIGPLTNVAAAIQADPGFAANVRHLWVMGGDFSGTDCEHNFRSDDVAASVVLSAGIPATVTGVEITRRVTVEQSQLDQIAQAGELGRILQADIRQWWAFWSEHWNVPHDPVTVLTLTRPDLFTFSAPGRVTIELGGEQAGRSTFTPDEQGTTRIVTDLDAVGVAAAITRAIVAAGRHDHDPGSPR